MSVVEFELTYVHPGLFDFLMTSDDRWLDDDIDPRLHLACRDDRTSPTDG